jgi:hypothetical protein
VKLLPDKIGGSPKQWAILGGLAVLGVVSYLVNRNPSGPPVPSTSPRAATQEPVISKAPTIQRRAPNRGITSSRGEDFRPTLKLPEGMDVSKIDPTIKLALLEKVRHVSMETGSRGSVFAFGQAPPPPPPPPGPKTILLPTAPATAKGGPEPPKQTGPASPPPAPPIPLKFYGYSNTQRGGPKRAFFLDGEDIDVVTENDVIKNRYKIIRIGVNSVVVEDLNFKSQQTLPLIEELAG